MAKIVTVFSKGHASKRKKDKFNKKAQKVTKLGLNLNFCQAEEGFRPTAWYLYVPYKDYTEPK